MRVQSIRWRNIVQHDCGRMPHSIHGRIMLPPYARLHSALKLRYPLGIPWNKHIHELGRT